VGASQGLSVAKPRLPYRRRLTRFERPAHLQPGLDVARTVLAADPRCPRPRLGEETHTDNNLEYYTNSFKYPSEQRRGYHNRIDCPAGEQIIEEHREKGKGSGRHLFDCCKNPAKLRHLASTPLPLRPNADSQARRNPTTLYGRGPTANTETVIVGCESAAL